MILWSSSLGSFLPSPFHLITPISRICAGQPHLVLLSDFSTSKINHGLLRPLQSLTAAFMGRSNLISLEQTVFPDMSLLPLSCSSQVCILPPLPATGKERLWTSRTYAKTDYIACSFYCRILVSLPVWQHFLTATSPDPSFCCFTWLISFATYLKENINC